MKKFDDPMLRRSKDSEAMVPYWDLSDDLIAGIDAIKANITAYLPMFPDEEKKTYQLRQTLVRYTNVYGDIVESLASKPFEEEIGIISENENVPTEITDFFEDVDGDGNNMTVFGSNVFFNGINSAIHWIFVDHPTVSTEDVISVAQAKRMNIRPFWSHVLGRNVLEARVRYSGGKVQLVYIRIYEPAGGGTDERDHVRVFERSDDGRVHWTLYVETDKVNETTGTRFVVEAEGDLTIDEIPLVPFITGRRDGKTFKVSPPMRAAADLQKDLFRLESRDEFLLNIAGYPMLAANGLVPDLDAAGKPMPIATGPMRVLWGKPDAAGNHGSWAFVEPSGSSLEQSAKRIDKVTQNLRELGRQPLTAQSGNLTVITTAVAAGKAKSAVGAWALQLKDALENAMLITAKYMNIPFETQVSVYTEFDNFADSGADLTTLTEARKNRDISQETYLAELKRRSVLAPEFDHEQEMERLLNETPGDGDGESNPENVPGNENVNPAE